MELIVNGEKSDVTDGLTVSQLLVELKVKMPDMVSVQLNGNILKRSEFETVTLSQADEVEFLYYMGGGTWN
ncbi:MAG: sulfur carrier protein ThiS [Planctomycetota bacterium]|jgi:sulfur carrier protein